MDKNKMLLLGCGGCGNQQIDDLLSLDRSYVGLYMNTNLAEMKEKKHFDIDRRCFYIANADGTGKNKKKAESYIKEDGSHYIKTIPKFEAQKDFFFFASTSGGTGSTAVEMLPMLTKRTCPDKTINLILTFPDMLQGEIDYDNTLTTWNNILQLKNHDIINSIMFIDNNYGTEEEVNHKALSILNNSFDILEGNLDASDSIKVQTAKGYKIIIELDTKIRDTNEAIDKALKNSPFCIPDMNDDFRCQYVLANIDDRFFNVDVVKTRFKASMSPKIHKNNSGKNIIILGGCPMPTDCIHLMQELHKECIIKNQQQENNETDLFVDITRSKSEEKVQSQPQISVRMSQNEIESILDNDDLWDFLKH